MKHTFNNGELTFYLSGKIDSSNSGSVEAEMLRIIDESKPDSVVCDMEDLLYISSAGLRVLLRIRKMFSDLSVINVSSDVYEIFDVTGFCDLMSVSKAFRKINVEGCDVVGEGANGKVYRIDRDTIVKVYKDAEALDEIKRERELARTAFLLGVPTAIPYDVVKVGDTYGSVFELLNAKSFAELMRESEDNLEFVAKKSMEVAKIIHSTKAPDNLPDFHENGFAWLSQIESYLSTSEYNKFDSLLRSLPNDGNMIHGDYHIKNIMQQGDETLLIDMDTLSSGHPLFELAFMYNAYKGFGLSDSSVIAKFMGISPELAYKLWRRSLACYLDTDDVSRLDEVEEKASLIGLLRVMRRAIRRGEDKTTSGKALIMACASDIKKILRSIDTLEFRK